MSRLQTLDQTTVEFTQEIDIAAPQAEVFEGMIHRLTEGHTGGADAPRLPLTMERKPGGRWFRDLGADTGHLWGFVQSYRPPTLLELYGPMFMSYPVSGHMIIRFEAIGEGTRLLFQYSAFGLLEDSHRTGIKKGFASMLAAMQEDSKA